jgi:hypothetical protein
MFDNNTPTLQDLPQVPEGYNVEDTTATQEQPEQVEETEQVVTPEQPPQETSEERNFRNLRMKADRLEKERNEALQRLRSYESQQAPEEEFDLKPNDLAEGKHLNKVQNKIQSLEHQLIETRLRSQYPDIDSVVLAPPRTCTLRLFLRIPYSRNSVYILMLVPMLRKRRLPIVTLLSLSHLRAFLLSREIARFLMPTHLLMG